ncbi:MAG: DUF3179 domain-containing (seleno)protein [Bacteroidota bacterium]
MARLFYVGIIGLILFEILKVYFIMPMPGSQEMNSIDIAYFLFKWRWVFRCAFIILILLGAFSSWQAKRWQTIALLAIALVVAWAFNFKMVADKMFYQPSSLIMANISENEMPTNRLVIGIEINGISRAYPIQLIAYHHQVLDTIVDQPIMVTYCSVCRTGRVFEPSVDNAPESFRLVGMDHFNAMFEDTRTKSWWRQVSGEAIAGPLKGARLPELFSEQMTLKQWIELHPETLIMQPDPTFMEEYQSLEDYDFGVGRGKLTRTDTLSWMEKSWVVGVVDEDESYVIDWNDLKESGIINFQIADKSAFVALASDDMSFFAYENPISSNFTIDNDTLRSDGLRYDLLGVPVDGDQEPLKRINAYQEFWHSWQSFHPSSKKISQN